MPDISFDVNVALTQVRVNKLPLTDNTDFKSLETAVAYNAAGLVLVWEFTTTAGLTTRTAVTPTTGGDYDWSHLGEAMYIIEIPASGGASINNDATGFGQFVGYADGVLPFASPIYEFRDAALNNLLIDDAYSATRGLAGTALPDADADAAGGLPISDAGELAMDTLAADAARLTAERAAVLTDWIDAGRLDAILDTIATDAARLTAERAAVLTDWINDGRLDVILDTIAADAARVTAARAGALTDWIDGGRLDLLLDAIKAITDVLPDSGALTTIGTDTARLTAERAAVLTDWINDGRLDVILDAAATAAALAAHDAKLDTAQTDLDNPDQYKADVAGLATAAARPTSQTDLQNPDQYTANVAAIATAANQTTNNNRLGAFTGTGVNTILGFFRALLSKAAATPSDVGGTFDPAADSTEAISEAVATVDANAIGCQCLAELGPAV